MSRPKNHAQIVHINVDNQSWTTFLLRLNERPTGKILRSNQLSHIQDSKKMNIINTPYYGKFMKDISHLVHENLSYLKNNFRKNTKKSIMKITDALPLIKQHVMQRY